MFTTDYLRAQRSAPGPARLLSLLELAGSTKYVPRTPSARRLETQPIIFDRRASIAVSALLPEDRRTISFSLERLKREALRGRALDRAKKIKGETNTYLTRARDFDILFVLGEGQIEVQDVFRSDLILGIFGRKSSGLT